MALKQIDLNWISKDMTPGKWYNITSSDDLYQYMQLIDKSFGYPKFTLSLNDDYTQVRKIEI